MKKPIYLQRNISPEKRASDLLKRMTLDEKIAQLYTGFKDVIIVRDKSGKEHIDAERFFKLYPNGIGTICAIHNHLSVSDSVKITNQIQEICISKTRLGIPILFDCEALHGMMAPDSTSFPQAIALAATWNPKLVEEIAKAIGKEVKARNSAQVLSPVLDIARDVRAGRTEETYGEDPFLVTQMGKAFIRGIQSNKVITTPKHFVANFVGDGGRDSHPIHMSERLLREIYLPPYEAAIKEAGALSIMSAYHSLDGIPCVANEWLQKTLLKKEWKFKGTVVSDWSAVINVYKLHYAAKNYAEVAELTINSGLDVECPVTTCFTYLKELVEKGKVSIETINEAVWRVLHNKFWAGLFDNPYRDEKAALEIVNCEAHKKLALESARQSIVLLKNDEETLPLKNNIKKILVTGPNANVARLGGYSTPRTTTISPLEGIKKIAPANTEIIFIEGCSLKSNHDIDKEALIKAKDTDAVIMIMGNCAQLTEGEGHDRCNLDLPGRQEEFILEMSKVNSNIIVVLIGGSAVTMQKWIDKVKAIIIGWYPGQEGGLALAEIIFGKYSPSGKLPITFPKTTGQCPLYYNAKPSGRLYDYNDLRGTQEQFAFGHGLSYTTFDYSDMKVSIKGKGKNIKATVSAKITNTGKYISDEVVQLYIHIKDRELTRPLKELKGFQRVSLKPNESCVVSFKLSWKDLACIDKNLKLTLGREYEFMIGSSSSDIRLIWPERDKAKQLEEPNNDFKGYEVSELLPPIDDISKATLPPDNIKFSPVKEYFANGIHITDVRDNHELKHGLLYLRLKVNMPEKCTGTYFYGADGPVKVWLNNKEIDCVPNATNPIIKGEYFVPVTWEKGENTIIFALSTNNGKAWGISSYTIIENKTTT